MKPTGFAFLLSFVLSACASQNTSPSLNKGNTANTKRTELTFAEAHRRVDAQPHEVTEVYWGKWADINNSQGLDEKNHCYEKSPDDVQLVLTLDKDGLVTNVITDVKNEASQCFRKSYLNVKFPTPPFSPYYIYLHMYSPQHEAEEERKGDRFMPLFSQTCVKNLFHPERLRDEVSKSMQALSPKEAAFYLNHYKGAAWRTEVNGIHYVVAMRDDRNCSVFAHRAVVADVQDRFMALVTHAPAPLQATRLDDSLAGPNTETIKSIAYTWSENHAPTQIMFDLTTTTEDDIDVKAMATIAIVRKPDSASK